MFQVAHGVQFLEQPERKRVFVMSGGGNRNWRLIYLDGRALPQSEDVTPTYFGYSSGHWDGDTLVVESDAFVERFWFSNGGLPHTENLRLTEKFSRPDFNTLRYEVLVNDPGTYTHPWSSVLTFTGWPIRNCPNISARTILKMSLTWWDRAVDNLSRGQYAVTYNNSPEEIFR